MYISLANLFHIPQITVEARVLVRQCGGHSSKEYDRFQDALNSDACGPGNNFAHTRRGAGEGLTFNVGHEGQPRRPRRHEICQFGNKFKNMINNSDTYSNIFTQTTYLDRKLVFSNLKARHLFGNVIISFKLILKLLRKRS